MTLRCGVWLVALVLMTTAAPAGAQVVFRAGVDVVHVAVTVQDRASTYLADLRAEDFEVYEDDIEQRITYFARVVSPDDVRLPLHLGLLLDTSGSMERDLARARTAAIKFLNTLPHAVDMTVVDFDTEVRVGRFTRANFPHLVARIRSRKPGGWTALYDALGVYLDGASRQDGQKILVLYSDGGDTRSSLSFGDVLDLVKLSDVTIYAIGFLPRPTGHTELRMRLRALAEQSGGRAFFPTSIEEIERAYDDLVAEVGARYVIGYTSTNDRADGAWRDVDVRLSRDRHELKNLKVRSRKGYFGPYFEPAR